MTTRADDKKVGTTLERIAQFVKSFGDPKSPRGLVGLLVGVATVFVLTMGNRGELANQDQRLQRHGTRISRQHRDIRELERARHQLNDSIERAVARGIRLGVRQALAEIRREGN